jgi:hypothetical protein
VGNKACEVSLILTVFSPSLRCFFLVLLWAMHEPTLPIPMRPICARLT